jgi:ABC-type glycerol-3-phosphate transport system permease component
MSKTLKHDLPIHIFLGVAAILTFFPFVFMVMTSFKATPDFVHNFWGLPQWIQLSNYSDAYIRIRGYITNSLFISITTMLGVLVIGSISAFVFARFDFPGREPLFIVLLALLMIPGILTLVPAFLLVKTLGLMGGFGALIVPYIAGGQVFGIYVMRSFFASLPEELFEAARMDGASTFDLYSKICLPLSRPILVTVAIMNVLGTWNDHECSGHLE